ncbi:unnamed protein product [Vicia faba]|uniref:Uncharacterized protein n=1 Tax=Vicia faba TaxID=3906 RepID=A0AAV0YYE4_VICFA|nr:unnamed protein product [Vicia faba]
MLNFFTELQRTFEIPDEQDKILEETKSEEASLPVHVLWKEARVGKNQAVDPDVQRVYTECETLSQSASTGEESVLSRVLDAPENFPRAFHLANYTYRHRIID